MIVPTFSFSQTILKITNEEIKTANLIFLEHKKLSKQNSYYKQQVKNLEEINKRWEKVDSLNQARMFQQEQIINDLQKSVNRRKRVIRFVVPSLCVISVLCLIK